MFGSNVGTNHVRVIDDIAYSYVGSGQVIWSYNLKNGNSGNKSSYWWLSNSIR